MNRDDLNEIQPNEANILVVDDELANVNLIQSVLDTEGYKNVTTTTEPRDVLGLCQQNEFDLILLDINMPNMDGYQVLEQLNEFYEQILPPVLMLTAQMSGEFKKRAFDSGARDYVTKPFSVLEVLARVKNLLQVQLMQKFLESQNERLEYKVQQRTKEINQTRLEIVRRLGRAAEYRDNETGLHIVRMSKISMLLGLACGLDSYQADLLLNASPMHDIGKIGIPDHVLLKPGKLESDEWEKMKTHTQIGANILSGSDSDLLIMASEIALSHHEKWDGSGYPNNLQGEEIPLMGRIVAVADVFDALTSERPYKKAWEMDEAVKFMNQQSGSHFSPDIIEHFNSLLPEITEVKNKYSEPT